jgi:predicted Zn-dependent protease
VDKERIMKTTIRHLRTLSFVFLLGALLANGFPAQARQEQLNKEPFVFGQVDLTLLEQADLLDAKLAKEGLVYNDKELEAYINQIGQSLLPSGAPPERVQWRFRVLRDPLANAFALPNGSIYIHSGLLSLLENESQIAGVIAHEIAHVRERHSYHAYRSMRKKALAINLLAVAGSFAPINTVGTVIAVAASVSQHLLVFSIFGYSRELERDADYYAVNRLIESKYNPREIAGAFKLLGKDFEGGAGEAPIFYRDHDKLEDRIKAVNQYIAGRDVEQEPADAQSDRVRYLAATEKVARHNNQLAVDSRRYRTAIALGEKLVAANSNSADNLTALADAYRQIGPRTPALTDQERSDKGKKDLQKLRLKMTLDEEEKALMATPTGQSVRQENQRKAEEFYQKALALDPANARAYLGLGLLHEAMGKPKEAITELRKFLELQPQSADRQRVLRRIEAMEKTLAEAQPKN